MKEKKKKKTLQIGVMQSGRFVFENNRRTYDSEGGGDRLVKRGIPLFYNTDWKRKRAGKNKIKRKVSRAIGEAHWKKSGKGEVAYVECFPRERRRRDKLVKGVRI